MNDPYGLSHNMQLKCEKCVHNMITQLHLLINKD